MSLFLEPLTGATPSSIAFKEVPFIPLTSGGSRVLLLRNAGSYDEPFPMCDGCFRADSDGSSSLVVALNQTRGFLSKDRALLSVLIGMFSFTSGSTLDS